MKRCFCAFALCVVLVCSSFAQVLEEEEIRHVVWTGAGNPFDAGMMFYGASDVFQARFDVGKTTMEGMLNLGALATYRYHGHFDNLELGTTNLNPLAMHYGRNSGSGNTADDGWDNSVNSNNTREDAYYLNFFYHINRNLDFGMGTKLNWKTGPCPDYGDWVWGADAHVRQGGFSTAYDDRSGSFDLTSDDAKGAYKFSADAPGSADVVGFVPFANSYAKRGFALRFVTSGDFDLELGTAMPNGFNTDDPAFNVGAMLGPAEWLSVSAVLEGALDDAANFYTGATVSLDVFTLDVYFAADTLFTSASDDQSYGTGVALMFAISNTSLWLRPEVGVNFFENPDYTPAWYTDATLYIPFNKEFVFSVFGSVAFGSKDKRWDDYDYSDDWDGGHILTVRPALKYEFSRQTMVDIYLNLETREAFDGKTRGAWSTGLFVTHSILH